MGKNFERRVAQVGGRRWLRNHRDHGQETSGISRTLLGERFRSWFSGTRPGGLCVNILTQSSLLLASPRPAAMPRLISRSSNDGRTGRRFADCLPLVPTRRLGQSSATCSVLRELSPEPASKWPTLNRLDGSVATRPMKKSSVLTNRTLARRVLIHWHERTSVSDLAIRYRRCAPLYRCTVSVRPTPV